MTDGFWDETEAREEREDEQRTLLALKTTLKSFAIIATFCSIRNDAPCTTEPDVRQNLVAYSMAVRLYSKPCCRVLQNIGNKALDHSRVGRRFINGQSIDATMVNAAVRSNRR